MRSVLIHWRSSRLRSPRRRRPRHSPDGAGAGSADGSGRRVWDPAAGYITAGQDEPGYRSWYLAAPWRAAQVKSFNDYLTTYQVSRNCADLAAAAHRDGVEGLRRPAVRGPAARPNGRTWSRRLRYIHDYVIPAVGPVEPVSVYRNPALNQCAGGAPESAHKTLLGDRPGPAAADHARGADEDLVHEPFGARRGI